MPKLPDIGNLSTSETKDLLIRCLNELDMIDVIAALKAQYSRDELAEIAESLGEEEESA